MPAPSKRHARDHYRRALQLNPRDVGLQELGNSRSGDSSSASRWFESRWLRTPAPRAPLHGGQSEGRPPAGRPRIGYPVSFGEHACAHIYAAAIGGTVSKLEPTSGRFPCMSHDNLLGKKGNDKVSEEKGDDTLKGAGGMDKLKGGGGKNACIGGKGNDSASKCEVEKSIRPSSAPPSGILRGR